MPEPTPPAVDPITLEVVKNALASTADEMTWEALTPEEILGRFAAAYQRAPNGQPVAIELPPVPGDPPRPTEQAAADFAASLERREG